MGQYGKYFVHHIYIVIDNTLDFVPVSSRWLDFTYHCSLILSLSPDLSLMCLFGFNQPKFSAPFPKTIIICMKFSFSRCMVWPLLRMLNFEPCGWWQVACGRWLRCRKTAKKMIFRPPFQRKYEST